MKTTYILMAAAMVMLSSCRSLSLPLMGESEGGTELLRDTPVLAEGGDTLSLPWRQMYTDATLQGLIETALRRNAELRISQEQIRQSAAQLTAARKAFLPSLSAGAQGTVQNIEGQRSVAQAELTPSWEIDLFGRLSAEKKSAYATWMADQENARAVRSQLIGRVANAYYTLIYLDRQADISERTIASWKEYEQMTEALIRAGKDNETALLQAQGRRLALESSLLEIRQSIHEAENSLSTLVGQVPQGIARQNNTQPSALTLQHGIALGYLSARPDVRQAEWNLMQTMQGVNAARAAFYPRLTLSGTLGWTSDKTIVYDPAHMIANAVASLAAPIFNKGQNRAQLEVMKSRHEQASITFQQMLLDAGREVNDAYTALQQSTLRLEKTAEQLAVSQEAERKTRLLHQHSSSSYLEVLTAQQSLLEAELSLAQMEYNKAVSAINLYRAIGGGTE